MFFRAGSFRPKGIVRSVCTAERIGGDLWNLPARLKQNYEFRRLYSKGKSCANAYLVVYCRKNRAGRSRIGYTVSNKVGHAVVRNRIRRRLREIYRLHERQIARGYDLVVVSRVRARTADYHQLEAAFLSACAQLGLLTEGDDGV